MTEPSVILGIRELPRPPQTGYLYYKMPPKFSEWKVRTIAVLDLYNVDEDYLTKIFHEGIAKMLKFENLTGDAAQSLLSHPQLENIKPFAQKILEKVIHSYLP